MEEDESQSVSKPRFDKPKEAVIKRPLGLSLRKTEEELESGGPSSQISSNEKLVNREGGHDSLIERKHKIRPLNVDDS